jgi:hypothetical protein
MTDCELRKQSTRNPITAHRDGTGGSVIGGAVLVAFVPKRSLINS